MNVSTGVFYRNGEAMYTLCKCSCENDLAAQSDLPWPLAFQLLFWQFSLPSYILKPCACSFVLQLPGIGTDLANIPLVPDPTGS